MSDDLLQRIQRLQFTERSEAESLLRDFINDTFPQLTATHVELRPQAVSLNSFNGFVTFHDGERLFFKTHVEQDNVVGEYYNAQMLADAGYAVIQPRFSSKRYGQQLLIYDVVTAPSVFDLARQAETKGAQESIIADLTTTQNQADDELMDLYRATLEWQDAGVARSAPVHQLFYHRLTGGRLDRYYGGDVKIAMPNIETEMGTVRDVKWTINGQHYQDSINDIIQRAIEQLQPSRSGASIIGHGDAHNGNVFYTPPSLTYFDPAFAGRHHPLLDLTKPLFHNVFAMWMYFPEIEATDLDITLTVKSDRWFVSHNYELNVLRRMFLDSKVDRVLIPTLQELKRRNWLPEEWRSMLKSALFCCPFLTLNLRNFPPKISLLGVAMAVEMGAESSEKRSTIDQVMDRVDDML